MKVLFVSSGNIHSLNPIIENQGESLKREGIELDYFTIRGKGIKGYLANVMPLRKSIREGNYDIIHAHYSLSAVIASLVFKKPLIVSLMGSDLHASGWILLCIRFLSKVYWNVTIVKSDEMKSKLGLKRAEVIPNGVNTAHFRPMDRLDSCSKLGWDHEKKHILFPAAKSRPEKNFQLANEAFHMLDDTTIQLHTLENVSNQVMPYYYNAADVVLMTSLWEGSPNVIKEALACDVPIVATDVGDIRKNIGTVQNCYVTHFNSDEIANALKKVFASDDRPKGHNRINELDLGDVQIANRLIAIYTKVLEKRN